MSGPSLQTRRTPRWFFEELSRVFGPFTVDLFASPRNALLPRYFTRRDNALEQHWTDNGFANPPFKLMGLVVAKALQEAYRGKRTVIVGPVGGSQAWYHGMAIKGTIYTPDCRINFDTPEGRPTGQGSDHGADRDTMVLAIGGEHYNPAWQRGLFLVKRLELGHVVPRRRRAA